jgi:hypothetical protein
MTFQNIATGDQNIRKAIEMMAEAIEGLQAHKCGFTFKSD